MRASGQVHPTSATSKRLRVTAVSVVVITALLGTGAAVPPASAHTDLVATTPTDGARLRDAPRQVSLDFTDEMSPELSTVTLTVGEGAARKLAVTSAGPSRLEAALPGADELEPRSTAAGNQTWVVGYRVVSADGHPIAGQLRFDVPSTPTDPTAGGAAKRDSVPATETEDESTDGPVPGASPSQEQAPWMTPLLVAGAAVGILLLGGSAAFRLTRRSGRDR